MAEPIRTFPRLLLSLLVVLGAGCASRSAPPAGAPGLPSELPPTIVTATILQMNDVYEIMPLGGSGLGGLARIATLVKDLERDDPNTFVVLAGDLLSPSAMTSARAADDGGALNGQHMVDIMNRVGLDVAVLGNHEFDLRQADFAKRIAESRFQWIGANVTSTDGTPLTGVTQHVVLAAKNAAGQEMRLGIFGVLIDSNRAAYVSYTDAFAAARAQVDALTPISDAVLALTHLAFAEDERLAESVPGIALIMGGHEHQNITAHRGSTFTPITKADSNAKSVYVHQLSYDTATKDLYVHSDLVEIDDSISEDPDVAAVVTSWRDRAFAAFRKDGMDPDAAVTTLTETLDGRESVVRYGSTNMTAVINNAMIAAFPGAQASVFNSGSIRIDDTLGPGPITQYDVLRMLPYKGDLKLTRVKGDVLSRILDAGRADSLRGQGGWLQYGGVTRSGDGAWLVGGAPVDPAASYQVVINDYLLGGNERGLEWIAPATSGIDVLPPPAKDMRVAVIDFLARGGH